MKGILRKIVSLALVVIMVASFCSYAAVVTDNDASAFVTKAEFEAIKNNVQGQIDAYNTNLDNAIDGAIASYLATFGGGTGGASQLKDLQDVDLSTRAAESNDVLTYNGTTWGPRKISYGTSAPSGGNNGDIYIQYSAS